MAKKEAAKAARDSAATPRKDAKAKKRPLGVAKGAHDTRRALVGELPHRPLPLSDHEFAKTLGVVDDGPAPAVGVRTDCAGCLPAAAAAGELAAEGPTMNSETIREIAVDLGWHAQVCAGRGESPKVCPTTSPRPAADLGRATPFPDSFSRARLTAAAQDPRLLADPVAYYRAHPPRTPPAERPADRIAGFKLLDSDQMDAAWRDPTSEEDEEEAAADSGRHNDAGAADATDRGQSERPRRAVRASPGPPSGGIMSPKMSAATKCEAAEPVTP